MCARFSDAACHILFVIFFRYPKFDVYGLTFYDCSPSCGPDIELNIKIGDGVPLGRIIPPLQYPYVDLFTWEKVYCFYKYIKAFAYP